MTTITIEGPGGGVNFEAEIIKEALEAEGVTVEVQNSYPDPSPSNLVNIIRERLGGPWGTDRKQPPIKRYVIIKVKHIPWGG